MSPKLLRTLFGDPTEALEDRGDELRLNGFHREAAWYYRQALQRLGPAASAARRQTLTTRWTESRATAFRQILDEAESMLQRGRRREALALLADAECFAEGVEERTEVQGLRQSLKSGFEGAPHRAMGGSAGAAGMRTLPGAAALDAAPFIANRFDQGHAGAVHSGAGPVESPPHASARLGPHHGGGSPQRTDRPAASAAEGADRPGPDADPVVDPESLRAIRLDPQAAVVRYTEETRCRPESASAHELLAEALKAAGSPQEARTQYEAAYRRNPERLRLVVESARLLRHELADPAGALLRLEQACRRHRPTQASLPLHLERLFLLAELERFDEALAGFADLLSVSGLERGALLFDRAGVLEKAGLPEMALADLELAVQGAPDNLHFRERLADLCVRQERARAPLELGLRHLEEALELVAHDFGSPRRDGFSPDRARLTYKLARILFLLGRDEEAAERIEDAMIVCSDPRVQEALLDLRRELGR